MDIINGKIINIENGENHLQPALFVLGIDDHIYMITTNQARKFVISDEGYIGEKGKKKENSCFNIRQ